MAIDASSYGTTAGVAKLTPRYANGAGDFDAGTTPTLTTVESWIDQISGFLNVLLTNEGYSTPVTTAATVSALDLFVNQEAAALVEATHNAGRFGPTAKNPRAGRFDLIFSDASKLIDSIVSRDVLRDVAAATAVTRSDGWS